MAVNFLRPLGIFGLEDIEEPLLAGLVTGDPVLLIGTHGSAKTTLVESLALALNESFWAYPADKTLFEEVIGWPDVSSLAKGHCQYVPTPLSIWDKSFVLLDEISRANPSMQSKWLEIIRHRRVMGQPVAKLRYVFAAMNPLDYPGAFPLDPALAGRFVFIIKMPEAWEMNHQDTWSILKSRHQGDAPALFGSLTTMGMEEIGARLCHTIEKARALYPAIELAYSEPLSSFLYQFNRTLTEQDQGLSLDLRRLAMMYRGILAVLCLRHVKNGNDSSAGVPAFSECLHGLGFYEIVQHMLPYEAQTPDPPETMGIKSAILKATKGHKEQSPPFLKNPLDTAVEILDREKPIPEDVLKKLVRYGLSKLDSSKMTERTDAALILGILGPAISERPELPIKNSQKARILETWKTLTSFSSAMKTDPDLAELLKFEEVKNQTGLLSLMLGLRISQESDEVLSDDTVGDPEAVRTVGQLIEERLDTLKYLSQLTNGK